MNPSYLALIPLVFIILVMLLEFLWNTTMPQVFNLKRITFWEALRLLLISFILFGGLNFNF